METIRNANPTWMEDSDSVSVSKVTLRTVVDLLSYLLTLQA